MPCFKYSTASVQSGRRGGVALARVSGVVTPSTAGRIIADSRLWAGPGPPTSANVVIYSGASIAIAAESLLAAASSAYSTGAGLAPTALVVSPDQLAMFRDYARISAERGVVKAAFLSLDDAHCWAARQALVAEEWARMRAALRSAP